MQIQLHNQPKQAGAHLGVPGGGQLTDGAFLLQLAASANQSAVNPQQKLHSDKVVLQVGSLGAQDAQQEALDAVPTEGHSEHFPGHLDSLTGFLSTDFLLNQQTRLSFLSEVATPDLSAAAAAAAVTVDLGQSSTKLMHKIGLTYWGFCASGRFTSDEFSAQWQSQHSALKLPVLSAQVSSVKLDSLFARPFQQSAVTQPQPSSLAGATQFQRQTTADNIGADDTFYSSPSPVFSPEWQKEMLKIQLSAGQTVVFYRNYGDNQQSTLAALQDWFDRLALQQVYWYVNGVASQGRAHSGS